MHNKITNVYSDTMNNPFNYIYMIMTLNQRRNISGKVKGKIIYIYIYVYMIYLLTAIGLTPGSSSTVQIYTQAIHRKTQAIPRTTQKQNNKINNRTTQLKTEQHK